MTSPPVNPEPVASEDEENTNIGKGKGKKTKTEDIDDSKPVTMADKQSEEIVEDEQENILAAVKELADKNKAIAAEKAAEDSKIAALAQKAAEDAETDAKNKLDEDNALEATLLVREQANADNLKRIAFEKNADERIVAQKRKQEQEQEEEETENIRLYNLKIIADTQVAVDAKVAADAIAAQAAIDTQDAINAQNSLDALAVENAQTEAYSQSQNQVFQAEISNEEFVIGQDNSSIFEFNYYE